VEAENNFYARWFEEEKLRAFRDIESQIGSFPFFIFLKGSKEEPRCKFTRKLVESLGKFGYQYRTFNILDD
jgi:glutaredoxin-related protein